MNLARPDWADELESSLTQEFGDGPRIASLATVDQHAHPQLRSIVIRELAADGSVWFVSDARSAKVSELEQTPHVQVLLWLASQRVQYRLTGVAQRQVDRSVLVEHWTRLSESSRGMFYWGKADSPGDNAGNQAEPPENLVVYRVVTRRVEFLSLQHAPHLRWAASETDGWKRHRIAP